MKTVVDELRERRNRLATLRFGEDKGRLVDLLAWLEGQHEITGMLVKIRAVNVTQLISPHGFRPRTSSREEIAAMGLHLLDKAKEGLSLHGSASKFGIKPPHGSRHGQDYVDEAMRCYINPLLDDLEAQLDAMEGMVTVERAVGIRFSLLSDARFQTAFPATDEALKKIAQFFAQLEEAASWFHVAVSCREVLGIFVQELQERKSVTPSPELKRGDTKGILTQLTNERSVTSDALIDLIKAVWTYVQSNVHRQSATKQDAMRIYLWTGMLISEVWILIELPPPSIPNDQPGRVNLKAGIA